jgi:uncharacterized protein YuzE
MAGNVKVWFDSEADFLEVQFSDVAGSMKETQHDGVMERVDEQGHVIGFSVLGVSRFTKEHPLNTVLSAT